MQKEKTVKATVFIIPNPKDLTYENNIGFEAFTIKNGKLCYTTSYYQKLKLYKKKQERKKLSYKKRT